MNRAVLLSFAVCVASSGLARAVDPPRTWIDKDTGHRVIRLTEEPGSSAFYFNINAYTPDGKTMVYNAPDGIHALDLTTLKTRLIVPNSPASDGPAANRNNLRAIVVGHKTNSVFFTRLDEASQLFTLFKANIDTGEVTKLVTLPPRANVATVNADETLGAGTYMENEQDEEKVYGQNLPAPPAVAKAAQPAGFLVQPMGKGEMMERRLAARIPLVLFTIDLRTGKLNPLLHSTDWVNHLLFSPIDPELLMYCHEGPWQKVDRIWTIHTDGTHNQLIHKRTMAMEIAGHEFWGLDGKSIWYDWQFPRGEDFFLAGYNLETQRRVAYHLQRNEWSIHFNLTPGETLFAGDGGDPGQVAKAPDGEWIELFHPQMLNITGVNVPEMWQPGAFHSEHLVNMARHNYRLEPNIRFSPDKKLVIFTSNIFGPSYVFAVEVKKTDQPAPAELQSTPELSEKIQRAIGKP